ncbi:MAG: response regulator transcription factor [Prevotella sp.]|nr:response regulator transcription factor [Prevotella sp.]
MKKLVYIIVSFFLLSACADGGKERAVLDAAQAIINDRPDSALSILDSLEPSSQGFSQASLRRWQLLRLMAQNKCGTVFHSDSIQRLLVEYYDRHGTPNDRMTAHYLHGRALDDMEEAPAALQAFQEAAACADTMATDCDKRQLAIVYNQAGHLLCNQYLPGLALSSFDQGVRWAMEAGDTTLMLNVMSQKKRAYYELADYEHLDSVTTVLHDAYKKRGDSVRAAKALGASILSCISNHRMAKAKEMLDYVDKVVSMEDMSHEAAWGAYLAYHGKVWVECGQLDSAEWAFRKVMAFDSILSLKVMANEGLLYVYGKRGNADSVYKYSKAYCHANDSSNIFRYSTELDRMQHLYNYDRSAKEAIEARAASEKKNFVIYFIFACAVAILSIVYFKVRERRKADREELLVQTNKYNDTRESYLQAVRELYMMRESDQKKDDIIKNQEEKITNLEGKLTSYDIGMKRVLERKEKKPDNIMESLHDDARIGRKADNITLRMMQDSIRYTDSDFYQFVKNPTLGLSLREESICFLMRMGFAASEIAILLGLSKSNLSNHKSRLLLKLFGVNGSTTNLNSRIDSF